MKAIEEAITLGFKGKSSNFEPHPTRLGNKKMEHKT